MLMLSRCNDPIWFREKLNKADSSVWSFCVSAAGDHWAVQRRKAAPCSGQDQVPGARSRQHEWTHQDHQVRAATLFTFPLFSSIFFPLCILSHCHLCISPPGGAFSSTPTRPSSCWSTATAWSRCRPPSRRCTTASGTRTASSTWCTPPRRPSACHRPTTELPHPRAFGQSVVSSPLIPLRVSLQTHTHTPLVLTVRTTNCWVCPQHMIISPRLNWSTTVSNRSATAPLSPAAPRYRCLSGTVLAERRDPGQVCLSVCPLTWWPQILVNLLVVFMSSQLHWC